MARNEAKAASRVIATAPHAVADGNVRADRVAVPRARLTTFGGRDDGMEEPGVAGTLEESRPAYELAEEAIKEWLKRQRKG